MLFKRVKESRASRKPKAVAFVDYEHWYISLDKLHAIKPDLRTWRDSLEKDFDIEEIYVFGDFSNQSLQNEVAKIREITNFIIETGNTSPFYKKDFTDFIMLDRIYQTALNRQDIDVYIIFSGDGHFSSVVRFLTSKQKKNVGIYGVRDAVSNQLKNSATWVKEIPSENEKLRGYYFPILSNLKYLEEEKKLQYPTFKATAETVSSYYKLNYDGVKSALKEMIHFGYIIQKEKKLNDKTINILAVNWEKAVRDGIWKNNI